MHTKNTGRPTAQPDRRRSRRWRGSAVLDAALVFPILLSLTFGTVEYGHFFYVKHTLQAAAREGARAAIVPDGTNEKVRQIVIASLYAAGLNTSTLTLDANYNLTFKPADVSGLADGTSVTIQVDTSWGQIGMRPLGLISKNKLVKGITVMRKEG